MPPELTVTDELHAHDASAEHRVRFLVRAGALLAVATLLFVGWRELRFMTDDAYITFRYIDHFRRGWGYTWNPPPFAPVEGYSNFLWMVLLHALWVITGHPPPRTANVTSLILAAGSLAFAFVTAYRLDWSPALRRHRFWLALCVAAFGATHRTFLTWTSSGLETSLFCFCTMLWIFGMLEAQRTHTWQAQMIAATGAALGALTRPDGALWVIATLAMLACVARGERKLRDSALAGLPLLLVPLHVLWRRAYYGQWVPNTYFAKQVSPWPEAGFRYFQSFALEHALWLWLVPASFVIVRQLRSFERDGARPGLLYPRVGSLLVTLTIAAHATYFILVVGGDHFEYRVFAHAVLPLGIALVCLLAAARLSGPWLLSAFVVIAALGEVLPSVHYRRSLAYDTRAKSFKLFVPTADAFPDGPLRSYAAAFDELQKWLTAHHVGTRHQEHKIFVDADVKQTYPPRRWGQTLRWEQRGVFELNTVGYAGWVMPEVAIIDRHGLNDTVVAHTPVEHVWSGERLMAHERIPPPGYVDCFKPNVLLSRGRAVIDPNARPLTDEIIIACETKFGARGREATRTVAR